MNFSYAAVKQLEGKYLVQNRVTGDIYESPQMLYMLVGMCLFQEYKGSSRIDIVKRFMMPHLTLKSPYLRQLWLELEPLLVNFHLVF